MSLQFEDEVVTTYRSYVRCENSDRCNTEHDGGRFYDTRAAAQTSACDDAKAQGWNITGNRALCPDCDNADSNQEDGPGLDYSPGDSRAESQADERRNKR